MLAEGKCKLQVMLRKNCLNCGVQDVLIAHLAVLLQDGRRSWALGVADGLVPRLEVGVVPLIAYDVQVGPVFSRSSCS